MARYRNNDWDLPTNANGRLQSWDLVPIAVLMDIRDELQKLNRLLECRNFLAVPHRLARIAKAVEAKKP